MTRRIYLTLFPSLFLFAGCQSASTMMPWLASNERMYSADEVTAMNNPVPAASQSSTPATLASQQSNAIAQVAAPAAAARIDQLIQAGREAIRESGDSNPMKLQEARSLFQEAIALDGTNGPAHHGIAIVADLQQDWPTAEFHYKQALSQKPQDASLLNDLGYSYVLQNRFHEATQYLNQAVQLSPRHERAHINLALLALKRGDRNAASTQLATIFSPADAQNTLAQLEKDVQQQAMAAPNTMVAQNTGQMQFNQPQANLSGSVDNRPVSVYPPGLVPNMPPQQQPGVAQNQQPGGQMQQQHFYGMPQNNGQQFSNAAFSGTIPNVYAGGRATSQPSANGQMMPNMNAPQYNSGTPVGGVLAAPQYAQMPQASPQNQHQNFQSSPVVGMSPSSANAVDQSSQSAPAMGLNTGPGSLFPIPSGQQANSGMTIPQQSMQTAPAQGYRIPPQANTVGSHMNQPENVNQQLTNGGQASQQFSATGNYGVPHRQNAQVANTGQAQYPNTVMQVPGQFPQAQLQGQQQPSAAYPGTQMGLGANPGSVVQNRQLPVQPISLPQNTTANAYGSPNGTSVPVTGTSSSPLAAYERQLQTLDSQYNQALQQMNGRTLQPQNNGLNGQ